MILTRHPLLLPSAAFALALCSIAGAWGFELIGGYVPCKLCLLQRNPYYIGLPILFVLLIAAASGRDGRFVRAAYGLVGLIFLISTGIAIYQSGAEWGWWPGPTDCGGGATLTSGMNLLQEMRSTHIVSCTEASLRVLGLSFAGWNAVVTAAVAGLLGLASVLNCRKPV